MSDVPQSSLGAGGDRRGGAFYDDPEVFERYQQHRAWALNPNAVMEGPALREEIGSVAGLRVLDLGCGDAQIGRELLTAGASRYLGIDGSERMVNAALTMLRGTKGEVVRGDIENLAEPDAAFDLVVSRMALHYIAEIGPTLRGCYRCLAGGGRVVITLTHPVITSHDARASSTEPRQDWVVDNYFIPGPRTQQWLGTRTVWYHRTVEHYVAELLDAGFMLTGLRECSPRREQIDDAAEYQRRLRIPLVLLLAGARPV